MTLIRWIVPKNGNCAARCTPTQFLKTILFPKIHMPHEFFISHYDHEVDVKFCFLQYYQINSPEELSTDLGDKATSI